jgi:serine/threonine-protein kinase RIO1
MKLHRLGRTSFRAVKAKRDYLQHRKSASWIYFSRLAAVKEYAFMCALHERRFPVPRPLGHSRHVVVMQLVDGVPLNQIAELNDAPAVAASVIAVIVRLARHGLVHCDLNEFNIMIGDDEMITVIDFPQMVSTKHPDAENFYNRDMDGVVRFFCHRFGLSPDDIGSVPFNDATQGTSTGCDRIDVLLAASGFGTSSTDANGDASSPILVVDGGEDMDDLRGDLSGIDMTTLALPVFEDQAKDGLADSDDIRGRQTPKLEGDRDVALEAGGADESFQFMDSVQTQSEEKHRELKDGSCAEDGPNSAPSNSDSARDYLRTQDGSRMANPECGTGSGRLNHAKIAERVRRQRTNRSARQQLSTRNLVKDSEKRKAKVEMDGSTFWG